ncbi:MAG: hypothetical protein OHK0039_10970 [Bacteroidia bacterium]
MQKFSTYLGFIMGSIFVFMGFFLPIKPPASLAALPGAMKILLGVLLGAYGLFRIYRSYRTLQSQ